MVDSLLDNIIDKNTWQNFLKYKIEKGHLSKKEEEFLSDFINNEKYHNLAQNIFNGDEFALPEKIFLNKIGSNKKRIVYKFKEDEVIILKLLSFLLYKYDLQQAPNCYSFRRNISAGKAINELANNPELKYKWSYKLDIKNYFNSISIPLLLPILKKLCDDDYKLYTFFEQLLNKDEAFYAGKIVREKRGVMAGTPISPFLANLYLTEADNYFANANIPYARYSDDIILFADTQYELMERRQTLLNFLEKYQLEVNREKERVNSPDQAWEFLGVQCLNGSIDLSEITKKKLKGKIRRKARSLRRWMLNKNVEEFRTIKTMIKIFNRKFFESQNPNELTWSRWFFPIVNRSDGFKEIDNYLQQNLRYIATGHYSTNNYKIKYQDLKKLGYKSLVNEYYKFPYNVLLFNKKFLIKEG